MTLIAELSKTGITVEETNLTLKSDSDIPNQIIELSNIKKIYLDLETRYIVLFFYVLLHIIFFLSVLAANFAVFFTWLLVVLVGVSSLRLMMGPPSRKFILIDLREGDQLKIPMKDSKASYFEFIGKANTQIHNPPASK